MVWPEKDHVPLVESVLRYAGCTVMADGLPVYLAIAIEGYCVERSAELRWAYYATLPPLIRRLTEGQVRILALNEYSAMSDRLYRAETGCHCRQRFDRKKEPKS